MAVARRFASALGLTLLVGAGLAPTAAAGELLDVAGDAEPPAEGCSIAVPPLALGCDALPIEIEVTAEPSGSVATAAGAATTVLQPLEPVAELPPVEPLESVHPTVAELAPAVEPVVSPSFSSAPQAVSPPAWSPGDADWASSVAADGMTPPAEAEAAEAEGPAARQELEPASVSAARLKHPPGSGSAAAVRATSTVRLARSTAAMPPTNLAPGAAGPTAVTVPPAVVVVTPVIGSAVAVAMDLGRIAGSGSVVFNVWLRRQLRERRMSQRQLAAFSGVDHSTISRLLSGTRAPSLRTATKLAEALRKLGGPDHAADYFARLSESQLFPTKRVEAALLGDDELEDEDVRELMNAYLRLRARRRRQRPRAAEDGEGVGAS